MPSPAHTPGLHPIQVVARRTGLTPEVLRIWEKRYAVVVPQRTGTGRRLYSDQDIARLLLLRQATLGGRRIGDVARLSPHELRALLEEDERGAREARSGAASDHESENDQAFLLQALSAVESLDGERLLAALSRARLALNAIGFLERVVAPLLRKIGALWEAGRLGPHQEHFASAVVRKVLMDLVDRSPTGTLAPVLVVATPAGDRHELGALLVAGAAAAEGWRVLYLGCDLPAAEIAQAALRSRAHAVGVSVVLGERPEAAAEELRSLRNHLPSRIPVLVGGGGAASIAGPLREIGALTSDSLSALRLHLHALRDESLPGP